MIFELLDAKRQRITTVTDKNLVDGSIRRELDDRFVKESLDVEFTLKMKDELDNARFLMVSDTGYLRGNPVFRIYQKQVRDTIQVVATSYTTEDLGGYLVNLDGLFISEGNPVDLIKAEFNKVGYDLMLDGVTITEDDLQLLDYQLPDGEVGIGRVLEELMLVLDVYGEFVFTAEKDEVVKVGIRLAKQLGQTVKRGLIYGVNITDLRVEERVEDIITAIEYTGEETVDSSGNVTGVLTLDGAEGVVMPKSKRRANVRRYVDENGKEMYILHDAQATAQYGTYNFNTGEMRPVVESYSDVYINNRDDLLQEAVAKLDGNSVPRTQYNISANVNGMDVGDVVEVQIPHLKVDRYLEVLSVQYSFHRKGKVRVSVGEHIPTELERRFEEIGVDNAGEVGGMPEDLERGKTISTPVISRSIVYAGGDYSTYEQVKWVTTPTVNMDVINYDYYLSFDYKLKPQYTESYLEIHITESTTVRTRQYDLSRTRYIPTGVGYVKLAEIHMSGSSGTVEVRLNDFRDFMSRGTILSYLFIIPFLSVYDEVGQPVTVNWLDKDKPYPESEEELKEQTGYLTNFTITEHERNMRDPEGFGITTLNDAVQLSLNLDFEE